MHKKVRFSIVELILRQLMLNVTKLFELSVDVQVYGCCSRGVNLSWHENCDAHPHQLTKIKSTRGDMGVRWIGGGGRR